MKLCYVGTHEVLEREELALFTELGIDCFSYQGAFAHPEGHPLLKRPGIPGMTYYPELVEIANANAKTKIPKEFFDNFDVIVIMHDPDVVVENWDRMKHKKVVWRTIGQSTATVENMVRRMRYEGLKIVRMSQKEENIIGFVGSDALIRFYKDPEEWFDWNGKEKRVINFTQTLKGRTLCHYDSIMKSIEGFPALIYGSGNTNLGSLDGGELPYDLMKGALRDNRMFIYGGTWPSPYTLSLQEAMMSGCPVVAIGSELANAVVPQSERWDYYEIPNIIKNGENGFYSDNINEIRGYLSQLLEDEELAKKISAEGRKTAIRLWGKDRALKEWKSFFDTL